jgi:hypothetical protein
VSSECRFLKLRGGASIGRDTDYRITSVHVAPASGPAIIDRTIVWLGDTIVSITDPLDVISSGPATATYAYPGTSNRLGSITPVTGPAPSFGYDAMGNITSDTRGASNGRRQMGRGGSRDSGA